MMTETLLAGLLAMCLEVSSPVVVEACPIDAETTVLTKDSETA